MAALEREAEALRAKADAERRRGEELARERDLLTKLRTQAEGASHRQVQDVHAQLAAWVTRSFFQVILCCMTASKFISPSCCAAWTLH